MATAEDRKKEFWQLAQDMDALSERYAAITLLLDDIYWKWTNDGLYDSHADFDAFAERIKSLISP